MSKLKIEFNEVIGEDHIRVVLEKGAIRYSFDVPKAKADGLHARLMYTHNFDLAEAYVIAAGGVRHQESPFIRI